MTMDPRSIYSPLDQSRREIRLLTILPCENDEGQIVCQLQTASLDDDPEYAAMSYVWGDAAITTDILVDNIPFAATTNLVSGLLQFRRAGLGLPGKGKYAGLSGLWIDAVCINQQEIPERNQQVALMGDIYMSARYVLSWLGLPGERNIDKSLRLIRSFSQALPSQLTQQVVDMEMNIFFHTREEDRSAEESDKVAGYVNDNPYAHAQRILEAGDNDNTLNRLVQAGLIWISEHPELHARGWHGIPSTAWDSIYGLMRLPYWKRVWVQQERILCWAFEANLIYCGAEVLTFTDMILFFKFVSAIDIRAINPPEIGYVQWQEILSNLKIPIMEPVVGLRAMWKRGVSLPILVHMLAKTWKATDPRDMVYGYRSVLNLDMDVDYGKTVREIYLEWHAEVLRDCRAHDRVEEYGIGMAGQAISKENPHNLPSWLPDLTILNMRSYVDQGLDKSNLEPGGRFHLGVAEGQQYSDDGVLSTYGVAYDLVCRISQVIVERKSMTNHPSKSSSMKELAIDYMLEMKTRDHPTGLRPLQVLFYTIHQGFDPYTREKLAPRLDPTSVSARTFRMLILPEKTIDLRQDWSHVDLEAAGGIDAYLDSRFRDTADADTDADKRPRWMHAMDGMSYDEIGQGFERFISSVERFLDDRVIFYTTDGYIGIGPEGMQVGDQLCVINNCHLPVLLREDGSGHVLVGSVYVYGLSENEPFDMLESGKVELKRFEIH